MGKIGWRVNNTIMVTGKAIIKNEMGIHVRPSGMIIKETALYPGKITLKKGPTEMILASIMDLLALCLVKGDEIVISVSGENEESYSKKLVDLFEYQFDFPPK